MELNIDNLATFKGGNFAVLGSLIARIYFLAFLIAISCIGCEQEYDRVISDMYIDERRVKIYFTEDRPALVIVEFVGVIGGCKEHDSTSLLWQGNTCYIEVEQSDLDPRDSAPCTDDINYHVEQIIIGPLDIGDYKININNQHTQEFQILPLTECQPIETSGE